MRIDELKNKILSKQVPNTIAFILDGNGRWAKKRGLARTFGHAKGIETLVKTSENCRDLGIKNIIVYAFSTENWSRPSDEVDYLMKALISSLEKYKKRLLKYQVRVKILGERENLSPEILNAINEVEELTKDFTSYTIGICFNYGGRLEIIEATKKILNDCNLGLLDINTLDEEVYKKYMDRLSKGE